MASSLRERRSGPNPLGLSVVRLVGRRAGDLLVEDLDVLDGTPLLDIKPYAGASMYRLETRGGLDGPGERRDRSRAGERLPDAAVSEQRRSTPS